jgi:putative ABC transport system permease protein
VKSVSKGSVSSALRTIRTNRGRSFMTMVGIVIGVFAAVLVVGIGMGVKNQVQGQVAKLGKDLITVVPGTQRDHNIITSLNAVTPGSMMTSRDVNAARSAEHVAAVTPLAVVDGRVSAGDDGHFDGAVIGTTSDFAKSLHQGIDFGSFFGTDDSDAQMAVVGSDVAVELFQENVPLGRGFSLRGQEYIVVGVLKPFESTPLLGQVNFNNAIFIPYETAQQISNNSAAVYEMLVRPDSPKNVNAVADNVRNKLLKVHGGEQTFSVLKQGQSLNVTNGIIGLISTLVLAAAATSLFVGGIGIMNIMLVSVTERMREIGIRKAIGATDRQIMMQFLTEALLLSFGGWLLGSLLGIAVIYLVRAFSALEPVVPWAMLAVSFLVTMVAGGIFGSVPALKAAVKDPIDALRNE